MELGKMNPSELDALLQVLKDSGVKEFQCDSFHVKFFSEVPAEVTYPQGAKEPAVPKSVWHDPSLWPDGRPPAFPAKDK